MTSTRYSRVELARNWDPAKHPRGPLGRFVRVSGAQSRALPPADRINDPDEALGAMREILNRAEAEGTWRRGTAIPAEAVPYLNRRAELAQRQAELVQRQATRGIRAAWYGEDSEITGLDEFAGPHGAAYPQTPTEADAYSAYTTHSGINHYLRTGEDADQEAGDGLTPNPLTNRQAAEQMDLMMDRSTGFPEDVVLYRGIDGGLFRDVKTDDVIQDSAFSSTTTDPEIALHYSGKAGAVLAIRVPAGTKSVVGDPDLEELVLPRNAVIEVLGSRRIANTVHIDAVWNSSAQRSE